MNPHFDPFAKTDLDEDPQEQNWKIDIRKALRKSSELPKLFIAPRPKVIGEWCRQGDLGFIFAPRGLGKTWLGMYFAHQLATGTDIGPWPVQGSHNVLYIDGEMPPHDILWRDSVLGPLTDKLTYLNHEILFQETQRVLNLADFGWQNAIAAVCQEDAFTVLFLDNLSTLVSGIDENKTIDWEKILPWLLQLRRNHILVVFIHHAGRSGAHMRGSSKREDPSAWIISLHDPRNDPEHDSLGAHFISTFTKNRNAPNHPKTLEWNFTPINDNEILVRFEQSQPLDVFRDLVDSGVNQCSDIAEEMDASHAFVSRLAKKAESAGWLEIKGRKYHLKNTDDLSSSFNQSADP
jgi:RecA-family ATPase